MSDPGIERARHEAHHYLQLGLLPQAVARLKRVLASDPDDAQAHGLLSLCLTDLKRVTAALHEAKLALTLEPDSALPHHALGLALIAHRRLNEAEEHLKRALELEPEVTYHHLALAGLYRITEQRGRRTELVAQALALDPEDVAAMLADGQLALERGDVAYALARGEDALRNAPQSVDAMVLVGAAQLRAGDVAQARDHALWALRENARHDGALRLMVSIKARENRWLGLWWRYNTWLNERGPTGAVLVLIGIYIIYRVVRQALFDVGNPDAAKLVGYVWMGLCVYSWGGPGMFQRALQKELAEVQVKPTF